MPSLYKLTIAVFVRPFAKSFYSFSRLSFPTKLSWSILQLKKPCYRRLNDLPNSAELVSGKMGFEAGRLIQRLHQTTKILCKCFTV